jgi:hypothetical protein
MRDCEWFKKKRQKENQQEQDDDDVRFVQEQYA